MNGLLSTALALFVSILLLPTLIAQQAVSWREALDEARQLRKWLGEARTAGEADFAALHVIEKGLIDFGL